MKAKLEDKIKAIELRKAGLSYKEIQKIVPVAKSSLSHWLSYLELSPEQETRLREKMHDRANEGRLKAAFTNRDKRIAREKVTYAKALEEFSLHKDKQLFLIGVILYWAEGAKKNNYFSFINSDPEMIKIMVKWIQSFLNIPKEALKYRLYIHEPYKDENCEEFWSKIVGAPVEKFQRTIYKPTPHKVKKNPAYKGCFRIIASDIDNLRRMIYWQKMVVEML